MPFPSSPCTLLRVALLSTALATPTLPAFAQTAPDGPALEAVATFPHQVTGVTVSEEGRIFVNFPRWTEDTEVSVAEWVDGELRPYPNEEWNAWRNARKNELSAAEHFVSVQSVVADGGNLWVLDPAAPATAFIVEDGPKLVRIDLATNAVEETIAIPADVAPQGSYLNDVRFSPDGGHAFITDSGPIGALIVVELASGESRRVLSGHPSVQAEPDVVVEHDGAPIRRPDGRGVEFSADGIALSADGETLFWQALTGTTLYSLPTEVLTDPEASEDEVAAAIADVGENGVSDGLWIDGEDRMYISALQEDAVKVREGQEVTTLIEDERLRWPDTFAEGPDGEIYVTTSRIMDMSWYDPEAPLALETQLWRFDPSSGE